MGDTRNNSPRLINDKLPPRVTEETFPRVSEVQSRYSIGTKMSKAFDEIEYRGKILRDNGRYHHVEYKDEDEKDMTHTEIRKYIPKIPYTVVTTKLYKLFQKTIKTATKSF